MERFLRFLRENIRLLLGLTVVIFAAFLIISDLANHINNPEVVVNKTSFKVTVAKTSQEQQIGLSNTRNLPQDHGMLFLFNSPDYYAFWMKEMKFPIDIIYINGNRVTTIIANAQPPSSSGNLPTFQPVIKSDKVLEVNAGLAKKYNIQQGTVIQIQNL